jgi:hypothetical protein
MRAAAARMDDALGNAFVIEVEDLSRSTKSSSSVGPRDPLFSEFWLSETGTPWLVVRTAVSRSSAR